MNIANLLARAGREKGERTALFSGSRPVADYATLARRSAAVASSLARHHGLAPGDRVALVMENCPTYIEALFACWHGGLVAVPINARLHSSELAFILSHSGARACFVTDDMAEVVSTLAPGLDDLVAVIPVHSADYATLVAGELVPVAPRNPTDTAWLFYTSGTTGRPKGAMLSHRNLLAMTLSYFVDVDRIAPGDCILHPAPMSHGSGMYILPHVAAAAAQVVPESGGFEPAEIFDLIEGHAGATFFAAPTMLNRLVADPTASSADTGNLKTIVYGGGPMYAEDCKRALAVLGNKMAQIYGQGESPMTITALDKARHSESDHPRFEARLSSVGTPHTVVEVMVADTEDQTVQPGTLGEVLVRGDSVMKGYWRNPEATAEILRNGWLHTGDIGVFDQDGFLTLKDRSKDLIISGGSNIYPREVEEVLLEHPAVEEVAVVGWRDREWGEVAIAFVVPAVGYSVDTRQLDTHCLEHLSRFKRPKQYRVVDALPKNNYGKVLKTELRRRLSEQTEEKS